MPKSKREQEAESSEDLIKSRSIPQWILLFGASAGPSTSNVVLVNYKCPAGSACEHPVKKSRHPVRVGTRTDKEVMEVALTKIVEHHADCVRGMTEAEPKTFDEMREEKLKKIKLKEETEEMTAAEELAKIKKERADAAEKQAVHIDPANDDDWTRVPRGASSARR